jgi:hypothetical protein
MMLALFEYLNAQLLDRQNVMFGDASPSCRSNGTGPATIG